jgi:tripartite-type tricarboxylate transporter receptor subunit TctC
VKSLKTALSVLALFSLAQAQPAVAQEFPRGKTLTIYVGFAAGGAMDLTARVLARKLSEDLGQSVVVENRPGAGGNIAQQLVVSAPPNGIAILLGNVGSLAINPLLMSMSYDPLKALAPITMAVNFPNVLVVNSSLGIKTFAQYLEANKKTKMDFASSGVGTASHLAGEMLNQRAGLNTVHVPYKGGNPAVVDLLGGRVPAYYSTPSSAMPYIKAGQIIALATTGLQRSELLPDVPTIAESGFPGFNATNWYAFVAPANTPPAILDRWNQEIVKALKSPDVMETLTKNGLTPDPMTRKELGQYLARESAAWSKVIKERHITLQ